MRIQQSMLSALLLTVFLSALSYATVPDRISGALTNGQTVTLKGNVHRKALPQFDQGPVDPAMSMGTVMLMTVPTAAQQKAITQLLAQQQDPKSKNYHKWLTPEQYADRFGLSPNDMQKMAAWLKAKGLTVIDLARGRNWISFTGTAAQVHSAFGTEIHHYKVNGELHYANATAPAIPAALGGIVVGLRGLHDFHPRPLGIRRNAGVRPDYNSNDFGSLVAPGDIATIYDINALYTAGIDGTGQKLAVRLLGTGIEPGAVSRELWDRAPFGYLRVLAAALGRAVLEPGQVGGRGLVWTTVPKADRAAHGVEYDMVEPVIDVVRRTQEAEVAVVFKQDDDGAWQVSARSTGSVDVGRACVMLGGGGHAAAAGFTSPWPVADTVQRLRELLAAEPPGQ